jgi:Rrf2 family protein
MISQTSEYALRVVVFLADHHPHDQTRDTLETETKVPFADLDRILHQLTDAGLLAPRPTPQAGYHLVAPAQDITVYQVVQAVAPVKRITECPLGFAGHGANLCPLHRALDNAMLAVETAFRKLTIHHLLSQPQTNRPLCRFPHVTSEDSTSG